MLVALPTTPASERFHSALAGRSCSAPPPSDEVRRHERNEKLPRALIQAAREATERGKILNVSAWAREVFDQGEA
jgi:hypothetical protein